VDRIHDEGSQPHLSMSQRTVDTHVNNIRSKWRSKNRIHMAIQLLVRDTVLLTPEDLTELSGSAVPGLQAD
jgi:hypothetical protein